jgi:hypothetical protein
MFKYLEVYMEAYSPVRLNMSSILREYLEAYSQEGWNVPSCETGHTHEWMSRSVLETGHRSVPDNLPGTLLVSQPTGILGN